MSGPTADERGLTDAQLLEDPKFLVWAKAQGQPVSRGTQVRVLFELLAHYHYEIHQAKRIKDEQTQRVVAKLAKDLDRKTDWREQFSRKAEWDEDTKSRERIWNGWRRGTQNMTGRATQAVADGLTLEKFLSSSHAFDTDEARWSGARYYFIAKAVAEGRGTPSDDVVFEQVVAYERQYAAERKRATEQADEAARPGNQLKWLQDWARKQPLNPVDDFVPGITYYSLDVASEKPEWVDKDVKDVSLDNDVLTIEYSHEKDLDFKTKDLDFKDKYSKSIVDAFARTHKPTGRLIPFVIYDRSVDLYRDLPQIDAVEYQYRYLIALPFQMTGAVQAYYHQDPYLSVAFGLLKLLKLMSLQKALPMAAPAVAGGLVTAGRVVTMGRAAVTGGLGALRTVSLEITATIKTFGFTAEAGAFLARSAYQYVLTHALTINTVAIVGADVGLALAGQDMGPISQGDSVLMAVQVEEKGVVEGWRLLRGDVVLVDKTTGKATINVTALEEITENAAKAEYQLGKVIKGETQEAKKARQVGNAANKQKLTQGRGIDPPLVKPPVVPADVQALGKVKVKLATPPKVPKTFEFENAMKQVAADLGRLSKKYNQQVIDKIKNLDAEALRESGINPRDLEKLVDSLARAGTTTQKFVNDFHAVPGFERVLLNWGKRSYSVLDKKANKLIWKSTEAFRRGTSYFMKYSVAKLDPKTVKFEFPVSINDTRWGEEVFARWVDIVVTGGSNLKPGQQIQIELKSWTEFVLRMKTSGGTAQRGTVGYQLIRDTALFKPDNIKWVFDGSKIKIKGVVIDAFMEVIADDAYLAQQWGGTSADPNVIRGLLDKVIEVF